MRESFFDTLVKAADFFQDGRQPCGTCVRYEYDCYYAAGSDRGSGYAARPVQAQSSILPNDRGDVVQATPAAGPSPPDSPRENTKSSAIFDPFKNRYMSDSSAVAFPRLLGIELSSANAPRLHSFAWNLGARAEPRVDQLDFTTYLTFTESERLVDVYFKTVHPVYDFINRESFAELCRSRFLLRNEKRDFDAVICGVAALGKSFVP
jgi:hypothetical protein